jgi:hypothetical protein
MRTNQLQNEYEVLMQGVVSEEDILDIDHEYEELIQWLIGEEIEKGRDEDLIDIGLNAKH